jgi:truncated hemoglobin YjbI
MVRSFYAEVLEDEMPGPFFADVVKIIGKSI